MNTVVAAKSRPKYAGLEIVRAIAALTVVYNHIFTFGLIPKSALWALPGQYATEAVIIFFVLSGVVITLSAERKEQVIESRRRTLLVYLRARLVRIYPIYLLGLAMAFGALRLIDGVWPQAKEAVGTLFFLQSQGYIIATPKYDAPLWTLGYEVAYYVLFGFCLLWGRLLYLWLAAALIAGSILSPPSPTGGVASHVISVLALSTPWIMGHLVARYKDRLPTVPVSLGLAIFAIGLVFDRCPLTRDFYDVFRLCSFALCCCPLLLAIVQQSQGKAGRQYWAIRIPLAVAGVALLWAVSTSLPAMKIGLTVVALGAAITPLGVFDWIPRLTRWAAPSLIYVGSISYAVYALHAPIIAVIAHVLPTWPSAIKIAMFALLLWALAHVMERIVQPVISRAIRGRRPDALASQPS